MRKSVTAAALAASLTIGGAAGAALFTPTLSGAQTDETPTEETTDDDRRGDFLGDALAPLVDDGTITQDQADAVIDAIHDARPVARMIDRHFPYGTALTDVLGIEPAELREALAGGQTIAEVAEANGVPVDDVVAALVAEAQEHLDAAVADGHLTQEEADEKAADLTERITAMVSGELERGSGHGWGPRRGGPGSATLPTDS